MCVIPLVSRLEETVEAWLRHRTCASDTATSDPDSDPPKVARSLKIAPLHAMGLELVAGQGGALHSSTMGAFGRTEAREEFKFLVYFAIPAIILVDQNGRRDSGTRLSFVVWVNYTYRALISGLCSTGLAPKALEFILDLEKNNHVLNHISFSELLHGFCKEGQMKEALSVWYEMENRGLTSDIASFTILVGGLLKRTDKEHVYPLVKQMVMRGLKPDIVLYRSIMCAYFNEGNVTKALPFLGKIFSEGFTTNEITSSVLVNGFCKAGLLEKAEWVQDNCVPNEVICGTFMVHFVKGGELDKAVNLHMTMLNRSLTNQFSFNMLMNRFCEPGQIQYAIDMLACMEAMRLSPDCVTYTTIIHKQCKRGRIKRAIDLWGEMVDKGTKPDIVAYHILI